MDNQNLKGKIVLFIGPVFYNYHSAIILELEKQGAKVIFLPERKYGFTYSLFNNISKNMLLTYQKTYYKNLLKKNSFENIDYLFVIRGCQMPIEFISSLKEKYHKMTSIMYQWDSENSNHYIHLKSLFDRIYTFDYKDSLKYNLKYLPLFYTEDIKKLQDYKLTIKYDFFTLCSYNRERYKILNQLRIRLKEYKLNFIIYIPKSTYYKEIIKGQKLSKAFLTFTPLERTEYLRYLSLSKVVIDISPSIQSGLPIRIIESFGAGKKIITTNQYALKEFEMFNSINILSENTNYKKILAQENRSLELISKYSLPEWLKKIFSDN